MRTLVKFVAPALVVLATSVPAQPTATHVRVASLSSSMDGSFQTIVLDVVRVGTTPLVLNGRRLTVSDLHGRVRSFTFDAGLDGADPPSTIPVYAFAGNEEVTSFYCYDFDCYGGVFSVPGYLLPIDGGTVVIEGMDQLAFGPLPVQGCAYRLRDGSDVELDTDYYGPCNATAVGREYYHAGLDHYFTTLRLDEMLALARGTPAGWTPTGKGQRYWLSRSNGADTPVCRILLLDPVRYSHFYSASATECAGVVAGGGAVLESGALFHVAFPIENKCDTRITHPNGAWKPLDLGVPVWRLWNGKVPPNHRYVTDPAERDAMVAQGWILEGLGPEQVAWCSPTEELLPPGPTP